jgi:hypothetical protein
VGDLNLYLLLENVGFHDCIKKEYPANLTISEAIYVEMDLKYSGEQNGQN